MHFPDKCPLRMAMRSALDTTGNQTPTTGTDGAAGNATADHEEREITFDALGGLMMGAEDIDVCQECPDLYDDSSDDCQES